MKITKLLNITKDALALTDFNAVGKKPLRTKIHFIQSILYPT